MTDNPGRTENPHLHVLPDYQTLLDDTDWASLATARGTGESLPAALALIIDPDPAVRAAATEDALSEVTHQNSIYEATAPVALYIAAILNHPDIAVDHLGHDASGPPHRPTLVRLLEWLSDTAYDADDEIVSIGEHRAPGFLDDYWEMRAFRDLRPTIFHAVHPLLDHDNADVRNAALVAAIPLAEHPVLTAHRAELVGHALRLLATSTDRHNRDRVLDAMKAWGYATNALENAADIAARERYARLKAEHDSWWALDGTGGYSEEPPF